jgi:phage baseplate assembly protein W
MARILQNRYPIDSNDRKAVGFGFPLNGPAVFVPTFTTRDQTKANFGADLRNLLFENVIEQTTEDLASAIQTDINNFFPQVDIKEIKFNNQPDDNTINFTLVYTVKNFGITDDITILLQ